MELELSKEWYEKHLETEECDYEITTMSPEFQKMIEEKEKEEE